MTAFSWKLELATVVEQESVSVIQILVQFAPLLTGTQAPPADTIFDFELQVWSNPMNCLHKNVSGTVQLRCDDGGMHIVLESGCHTKTVAPGIYFSRLIQDMRRWVEPRDKPTMPVTYTVR